MSQGQIKRRQIEDLFDDLESDGFIAKFNWTCCQTCGWAELHKYCEDNDLPSDELNIIFCHNQDCESAFGLNRRLEPKSKMINPLWLSWSGDGNKIKEAIESRGFRVEWDCKKGTRLQIKAQRCDDY